jgi:glycosyltransferase involved in cell wall biosynthesis
MKKKSTVLILGKLPPPYMGPAIATRILLASDLKNRFHLLHLDTRINASLVNMGKWKFRKVFSYIGINAKLFWICVFHRPDLVLVPLSQSAIGFLKDFIFLCICKITGRKTLLQLRGSNFKKWLSTAPGIMKTLVTWSMKWSSGMIVLGHNLKYLFRDYFPEEKIFVIPNGGDFHFPVIEKPGQTLRLLFFSNLFEAKGITDVLEAVKILASENPFPFHLDVAGSWLEENTKRHCLELVEQNKLPVAFYPSLSGEEKIKRFASNDVFIFTPRDPEGHPWVIVEALAAGLPIIATDKGAIRESVIDGSNGFIVADRSPAEIAAKIRRLADQQLRGKMVQESGELYRKHYTEMKMVEKYTACFETVIG